MVIVRPRPILDEKGNALMKKSLLPLATVLIFFASFFTPALMAGPAGTEPTGLAAGLGDPSENKIKVVSRERRKKDLRPAERPSEPAGASWGGFTDSSSLVD